MRVEAGDDWLGTLNFGGVVDGEDDGVFGGGAELYLYQMPRLEFP